MPKKFFLLKFMQSLIFFVCLALLAAACLLIRSKVLRKAEIGERDSLKGKLTAVLPAFDNEPWRESFKVEGVTIYPARHGEKISLPDDSTGLPGSEHQTVIADILKGFAFQIPAADGEGNNPVWVGLNREGELTSFSPSFLREANVPENFTKNITSGTMASRILFEAVSRGKEFFETHKNFFYSRVHESELGGESI